MRRLLLACLALAACGGAALGADREDEPAPDSGLAPVARVDPGLGEHFRVLRRARSAGDSMPAPVAAWVRDFVTGGSGAAPGLARRSLERADGLAVYVVPGRGVLCQFAHVAETEPVSGSCTPTADALEGRALTLQSPAPGVTRIVGAVPDAVRELALRAADGTTEPVAIVENAFAIDTRAVPQALLLDGRELPVFSPEGLGG
jgi:hypothetical protein